MKKVVLGVLVLLMAVSSYANEFDLKITNASVREAAAIIAAKGNVRVIVDEDVNANTKISMNFTGITSQEALMLLASQNNLSLSWDGKATYLISKLSQESAKRLQEAESKKMPGAKNNLADSYQPNSPLRLRNVSIGEVLQIIATSCHEAIVKSKKVEQSDIIAQINFPVMTTRTAFEELSKTTGLTVTKARDHLYLVTTDEEDTAQLLKQFSPPPSNPWIQKWPFLMKPLVF
jgi:hypothetical protein